MWQSIRYKSIKKSNIIKTVKTLFLVLAITFTNAIFARTPPEILLNLNDSNEIKEKIGELLKNPNFKINEDITAVVKFVFNSDNEIVVLSVKSESSALKYFIKTRLNYQKLVLDKAQRSRRYQFPVKITSD